MPIADTGHRIRSIDDARRALAIGVAASASTIAFMWHLSPFTSPLPYAAPSRGQPIAATGVRRTKGLLTITSRKHPSAPVGPVGLGD